MKTVIISGGSKGIGAELVSEFSKNNYKVVFCSRNENSFTKNLSNNVHYIKGDSSLKSTHQEMVSEALRLGGNVDIYINNTGISMWKEIKDVDENFLDTMIKTNFYSTFWGIQAAAGVMKSGGSIINISSLAGKRGSANNSAYCAAKFAVNGLTQSAAKELGERGIRVNAVCPVYIKTENLLEALKENCSPTGGKNIEQYFHEFSNSQSALKRLPNVGEIVSTCIFLSGPGASAITGQCINVDCGVLPS